MERLSKNFIWMAASNIVSSLFSVVVFIYLARTLEPAAFGYFSYAFTIAFFLANFIELGLSTYGMREISLNRARVSEYASEIVSLRLLMSLILLILVFSVILLSGGLTPVKILILESTVVLFMFAFGLEWAFQGLEKMHMVFMSLAATSALQLGLIYIFIKGPDDVFRVPMLYFVSALPIAAAFLYRLRFRLLVKIGDLKRMFSYLASSLVIWLISIFAQVYSSLDIFILGLFRDITEVGYFTIARRVTGGATLLMIFLANALLPRLSCTFGKENALFKEATNRFLILAIALSALLLLPLIFLSDYIIIFTVGKEYLAASMPLKIMLVGLVMVLFNLPYSTGLIACRFEKDVLKQVSACAVLSVVLNILLMPRYGMIGASITFLFVEAMALVWILWIYNRKIRKEVER